MQHRSRFGVFLVITATLCFSLSSCLQVQNSFDDDDSLYAYREPLDLSDPAQVRLQNVRDIFWDYGCIGCHATRSGFKGFDTYSNAHWKSYWVTAGSPSESNLFKRLKWSGCNTGECNMPTTDGQITDEDIAIIEDWITRIDE